ncbi:tetratricopeptide repeat protein [candidate division KSB1 bacterium]|nr:tetratricopeptide repeat protein [candidate division KSB1 bacterium]
MLKTHKLMFLVCFAALHPLFPATTFMQEHLDLNQYATTLFRVNPDQSQSWVQSVHNPARIAAEEKNRLQRNSSPAMSNAEFLSALRAGDQAHARFDNQAALAAYQKALRLDSTHYDVLWKLTRSHVDVGFAAKGRAQKDHYLLAERFARRCVALYPDSAQGHFFLAVALGRVALNVGGKQKVRLSKEIKIAAEHALALDPRHDGAMHVLGRWHYELANLSWVLRAFAKVLYGGVPPGGHAQAAAWFEKALAINPNSPAHHLWLGETLIELKEHARAQEHLQTCLRLPDLMWDDGRNKKQAEKALAKIQNKLE